MTLAQLRTKLAELPMSADQAEILVGDTEITIPLSAILYDPETGYVELKG